MCWQCQEFVTPYSPPVAYGTDQHSSTSMGIYLNELFVFQRDCLNSIMIPTMHINASYYRSLTAVK